MNKVENKKHWYDKPLKFLYFLLCLVPFIHGFVLYVSPIDVLKEQTRYDYDSQNRVINETTTYDYNYYLTWQDKDYGPESIQFNTKFDWVMGNLLFTYDPIWTEYHGSGTIFTPLKEWIINIYAPIQNIFIDNPDDYIPLEQNGIALYYFLPTIIFYELLLLTIYIFLRIILFLPNVICYLLDWVERRLGKL